MPTAAEAAAAAPGGQFSASLAAGLGQISQDQTITFTQYNRVILPADGFAFWVRADILSPSAQYNSAPYNSAALNQTASIVTPAKTATVQGSLHYTTANNQDESEGFSINRVIFTSRSEIELLNTVDPKITFIGIIDGIRFAFSRRTMLFRQGGNFHYQGDAIYPAMASQIIDFPSQLDISQVVSNSLPLWLTLNQFCPMFPSFLVSEDIIPPWCSVHIDEGGTEALQATPYIDPDTGSHYQLAKDRVRLTFYGLRNDAALGFQDYVNTYALNTELFGIMNKPIMRDAKRTQAELNVLAQKKTIEYEVNYYQQSIRHVALQYIRSAFIEDIYIQGGVSPETIDFVLGNSFLGGPDLLG